MGFQIVNMKSKYKMVSHWSLADMDMGIMIPSLK